MLSGIGQFRSGLPYTMRTSGSLPEEFTTTGAAIVGLGPGMNGSGGDNRVYGSRPQHLPLSQHTGRPTCASPRSFDLGEMRQLELLAESFNLFNHQNVTELETTGYSIENSGTSSTLPTLCYLTINTTGTRVAEPRPQPASELRWPPSASRSTSTPPTFTASARFSLACGCGSSRTSSQTQRQNVLVSIQLELL